MYKQQVFAFSDPVPSESGWQRKYLTLLHRLFRIPDSLAQYMRRRPSGKSNCGQQGRGSGGGGALVGHEEGRREGVEGES